MLINWQQTIPREMYTTPHPRQKRLKITQDQCTETHHSIKLCCPLFKNQWRLFYIHLKGNLFQTIGMILSQYPLSIHKIPSFTINTAKECVIKQFHSKGTFFGFRFLFWSEYGNASAIRRAYMDGTNTTYIATKDLIWPHGLAIDFTSKTLNKRILMYHTPQFVLITLKLSALSFKKCLLCNPM